MGAGLAAERSRAPLSLSLSLSLSPSASLSSCRRAPLRPTLAAAPTCSLLSSVNHPRRGHLDHLTAGARVRARRSLCRITVGGHRARTAQALGLAAVVDAARHAARHLARGAHDDAAAVCYAAHAAVSVTLFNALLSIGLCWARSAASGTDDGATSLEVLLRRHRRQLEARRIRRAEAPSEVEEAAHLSTYVGRRRLIGGGEQPGRQTGEGRTRVLLAVVEDPEGAQCLCSLEGVGVPERTPLPLL